MRPIWTTPDSASLATDLTPTVAVPLLPHSIRSEGERTVVQAAIAAVSALTANSRSGWNMKSAVTASKR
jgi:hypothetical protein